MVRLLRQVEPQLHVQAPGVHEDAHPRADRVAEHPEHGTNNESLLANTRRYEATEDLDFRTDAQSVKDIEFLEGHQEDAERGCLQNPEDAACAQDPQEQAP